MSQQPRKINTNRARHTGQEPAHSVQQPAAHSEVGAAASRARAAKAKKKKKFRVRWWMPVLVVLALVGGVFAYAWNYVHSITQEIKPDSGTAVIDEVVKTAPEYSGDVVNVLICGIDYSGGGGATADGTNDGLTDMILYFQFDVKNSKVNMFQIPRNTYVGGKITCSNTTGKTYRTNNGQINSVMTSNRSENGGASVAALADVIAHSYRLPIDYYGTINMDALKTLVDVFGGIEVNVPQTISYGGSTIKAGYHLLNSDEVEFLLRNRKTYADGDIGRLNMQREFYAALFRKVRTATVADLIKLVPYVAYYIETDCPVTTLISLAISFLKVDSADIMICQSPVYMGSTYYNDVHSVVVGSRADNADLLNLYFREYMTEIPVEMMAIPEWPHGSTATNPNVQYMGQYDQSANETIDDGKTSLDEENIYAS